MKALRITAISLVMTVAMLFGAVVLVNLNDQPLDPELDSILKAPPNVPVDTVRGYQFLLGLLVPADQDPASKGEEAYRALAHPQPGKTSLDPSTYLALKVKIGDPAKPSPLPCTDTGYHCSDAELKEHAAAIETRLSENKVLLARFDKLLAFPGYGTDLPPTFPASSTSAFSLLQLSRLKLLTTSQLLQGPQEEKTAEALAELERLQKFFSRSLEHPAPIVDRLIQLGILTEVRTFITSAAKARPNLALLLNSEVLQGFEVKARYADAVRVVFQAELGALQAVTAWDHRFSFFNLEGPSLDSGLFMSLEHWFLARRVPRLFIQRNETINQVYHHLKKLSEDPCVASERQCAEAPLAFSLGSPLRNPVGRQVARILAPQSASYFKKLHVSLVTLSQPITL